VRAIQEENVPVTRREFITTTVAAGAAATLPSWTFAQMAPSKLKILVLGGGRYVGPQLIRAALARGHQVSAFNRGKTNPGLFPDIEHLVGDRYINNAPGLDALKGKKWDVVFDTWAREPVAVKHAAEALKENIGLYYYVSSLSVYESFDRPLQDEDAPRHKPKREHKPEDKVEYPLAKAWAEDLMWEVMGEKRSATFRPGIIDGEDLGKEPRSQRVYWPLRMRRGGEVLVPEKTDYPYQEIDVKDIATFMVHSAEKGTVGAFNLITAPKAMTYKQYLETVHQVSNPQAKLVPVSNEFLTEQKIQPFMDLPFWLPDGATSGFFTFQNKRAVAAGLTHRKLEDTVKDVLASYGPEVKPNAGIGGIAEEREKELLARWSEGKAKDA
jgi:2'-hydroxyisoflavone reductase